jgi:hypothetical protein
MAKRPWPLFLLAWLSLVPILGFFFGSLAAGWGLVSSRPRALVAAGIGAGGAILNLVALLALMALSLRDRPEFAAAKQVATRQSLIQVVEALEAYHSRVGSYPPSLTALTQQTGFRRPVNAFDPSAGFFPPRLFEYRLAPDGQSYVLFSAGPDKRPGTEDDMVPELPDSLRERAGLRIPSR